MRYQRVTVKAIESDSRVPESLAVFFGSNSMSKFPGGGGSGSGSLSRFTQMVYNRVETHFTVNIATYKEKRKT